MAARFTVPADSCKLPFSLTNLKVKYTNKGIPLEIESCRLSFFPPRYDSVDRPRGPRPAELWWVRAWRVYGG